jgi:hypothetical protein
MVSVEFNRFINYYKKTRDISNQSSGSERRDDRDGAQEKIIMVVQQDILLTSVLEITSIGCH